MGKEALWVLLTASVLAVGAYWLWPQRLSMGTGGDGSADGGPGTEISLEAAAGHYKRGTAVFADARPEGQFRAGHIEGAINLDPDLFDQWSETVFSRIPAEATIITYCDGERCTLSLQLSEKLNWLGYEKVVHLKNGWSLWKARGLPTAAGP